MPVHCTSFSCEELTELRELLPSSVKLMSSVRCTMVHIVLSFRQQQVATSLWPTGGVNDARSARHACPTRSNARLRMNLLLGSRAPSGDLRPSTWSFFVCPKKSDLHISHNAAIPGSRFSIDFHHPIEHHCNLSLTALNKSDRLAVWPNSHHLQVKDRVVRRIVRGVR